jgi:hypothetical protein
MLFQSINWSSTYSLVRNGSTCDTTCTASAALPAAIPTAAPAGWSADIRLEFGWERLGNECGHGRLLAVNDDNFHEISPTSDYFALFECTPRRGMLRKSS